MKQLFSVATAIMLTTLSTKATKAKAADKIVMIALGDSITTGFNAGGVLDQKKNSWAAGDNADRKVYSHYQRLTDLNQGNVQSINLARAGAVTHELLDQVSQIPAGTIPNYVTIMIGANDLCANPAQWNPAMTAIQEDLEAVITKLIQLNGSVKILLSSVPDMVRLREVGKTKNCQPTWNRWNICSALLGQNRTDSEVQEFGRRYVDVHDFYETIAERYADNVKYNGHVRDFDFEPQHLANIDCFHPSVAGQKEISRLNWENGWYNP